MQSACLTLVAVIMLRMHLFSLDLAIHRLYKIPWVVRFNNVLLGCRDHLA